MANLKEIRKRISSVKGMQKITRAMKMVAAAKLRKAEEQIVAARPYAYKIQHMIKGLVGESGFVHPLMVPHEEVRKVMLVTLTSDRGLAGAFNANIIRHALSFAKENQDRYEDTSLSCIGRKAIQYFRTKHLTVRHNFPGVFNNLEYDTAEEIALALADDYLKGEVDEVYVVYNEYKSAVAQKVVAEKLLPIERLDGGDDEEAWVPDHAYEPDREQMLNVLVPRHVTTQILRQLFESAASEQGARMTAMDNATENATEMIDKLTIQYNRARQAAITTELIEVISGAEAL